MQRKHSLAEYVVRGAIGGAVASMAVAPLASFLARRLGPQRLVPTTQLERTLERSLGIKPRTPFSRPEPAISARPVLLGLLWGAAYGAVRSSGEISGMGSGPMFGAALGALETWIAPRALRIFPTSNGYCSLPAFVQLGLYGVFGTVVGQVFEADSALVPHALLQRGISSLEEKIRGPERTASHHVVSPTDSDLTAPSPRVAPRPHPTSLRPADLNGRLVFARDDHALGQVKGYGQNYVEVHTPIVDVGPILYVPFDAFAYCTAAGCYLRQTLQEIVASNWNHVRVATEPGGPETERVAGGESRPVVSTAEPLTGVLIPFFAAGEAPH